MDVELLPKTNTTSTHFSPARAIMLLSVLLWLAGCSGPTSVTSLREHPQRVYSFEVTADCPTVYLRIARRAQERYRYTNLATFQPGVTATLAPDAKTANVTFFNAGGRGLEYLLTADLCALEPARTEVTAYCADRRAAQESLLWQQWANTPLATAPADPNQEPRQNPPAAEN